MTPEQVAHCPHHVYTLCASCFRALSPAQQAAIQRADGSQLAFLALEPKPVERPARSR